KVPLISGWGVFALLVASIGLFIALIERLGTLQVNRMLIFTGDQGRKAIDELYPLSGPPGSAKEAQHVERLPVTQTITHVGRPQVIQAIRVTAIMEQAKNADALIEVAAAVGDTVLELTPLLRVRGARQPLDEGTLMDCVELGDERTFQ